MKIAFLSLIFLLTGTFTFGQPGLRASTNSSLEQTGLDMTTLLMQDSQVSAGPEMVTKVIQEPQAGSGNAESRKFFYQIETGYSIGKEYAYDTDFFKLEVFNGYRFNHFFSVGLGAGARYYYDERDAVVPIFVGGCRFDLSEKGISPFIALDIGYNSDIKKDFSIEGGGLLMSLAAGMNFRLSDIASLHASVNFEMQDSRLNQEWLGPDYPDYLKSVGLNLGISLNHRKWIF